MTQPLVTIAEDRGGEDERGQFNGMQTFDVIAASALDAVAVLRNELGVQVGQPYRSAWGEAPDSKIRYLSYAYQGKPHAKVGGTGRYLLGYRYGVKTSKQADLDGTPVYEWDGDVANQPIDTDKDGNGLVNSAGVVFEGLEAPLQVTTLKVSMVVAAFSVSQIITFGGSVNSSAWRIGDGSGTLSARQGLIRKIKRTPRADDLLDIEIVIEMREEGYDLKVVDQGFVTLNDDGDRVPIKDAEGNPVTEPVFLDGAGAVLGDGADPVILTFRAIKERDFNLLGI